MGDKTCSARSKRNRERASLLVKVSVYDNQTTQFLCLCYAFAHCAFVVYVLYATRIQMLRACPSFACGQLRRSQVATFVARLLKTTSSLDKTKDTLSSIFLVWVTRLELATPRPPVWCATKLRHTQVYCVQIILYFMHDCKCKFVKNQFC